MAFIKASTTSSACDNRVALSHNLRALRYKKSFLVSVSSRSDLKTR
jgi:hypothetical protein